jgi:hypothetical protein
MGHFLMLNEQEMSSKEKCGGAKSEEKRKKKDMH